MNQIKQKVAEIGLSQREISKRLGKNASYLAGVFRTGLSTAKQAELLKDLEVVVGGGTVQSDDEIIAELSQKLADYQDNTDTLIKKVVKNTEESSRLSDQVFRANQEVEQIESKYRAVLIFNYVLSLVILVVAIAWVLA